MVRSWLVALFCAFALVAQPTTANAHQFDYSIIDLALDQNSGNPSSILIRTHVTSLVATGRASVAEEASLNLIANSERGELEQVVAETAAMLRRRLDFTDARGDRIEFKIAMPSPEVLQADARNLLKGPAPSAPIVVGLGAQPAPASLRLAVPPSLGRTMVRLHCGEKLSSIEMIEPGQWSTLQSCASSQWSLQAAIGLARAGFEHVVPNGWDHILFVILVSLSLATLPRTIIAVSVFTVGHAISLLLAATGGLPVEPQLIELGIALSVAAMALHLLRQPSPSAQVRPVFLATMLAVGLLHGAGFANAFLALQDADRSALGDAIAFSIGIDAAHVAVLVAVSLGLAVTRRWRVSREATARTVASIVLLVALIWTGQRALLFF